jgi:mycofactocin biosynthesis protein MftB
VRRLLTVAPPLPGQSASEAPPSSSGVPTGPVQGAPTVAIGQAWNVDAGYRLDPQVALRAEPFGALAYHYGTRRLTFLRSPLLVEVVRSLEHHGSAAAAVDAAVPPAKRTAYLKALADLAQSGFIRPLGGKDQDAH